VEAFGIVDGNDEDSDGAFCSFDVFAAAATDPFGFEGFHEAFGFSIVVGITGPAHADGDVVTGETQAIFGRGVLGGFKRSSQHSEVGGCDEHCKAAIGAVRTSLITIAGTTAFGGTE
jgi:hypothetical protein